MFLSARSGDHFLSWYQSDSKAGELDDASGLYVLFSRLVTETVLLPGICEIGPESQQVTFFL